MEYGKEQLKNFIFDSQAAFMNGQLQQAFSLAKEAIKLDENCADAYQCAANVCMSLSRYEDAIEYYQKAVNCDPNNGNRYFSLGYAQASVNKIAETMQNFAKADELGLYEDAAGQMYHILGIVNQEFGKLDDALINLKKSELIIPADIDILKRKAVIYCLLDGITNAELPGIILDISRTMIYNILVSYLLIIH
ncbi:MAG: tetratricopeptide repeat protein [Ruminococcus sp.]|nr:tetratricopeptide repeat protein [Ruminococcus sp.]MBR6671092.1 tetratricopeptide repeat protein [Ruminococcus sp.]